MDALSEFNLELDDIVRNEGPYEMYHIMIFCKGLKGRLSSFIEQIGALSRLRANRSDAAAIALGYE